MSNKLLFNKVLIGFCSAENAIFIFFLLFDYRNRLIYVNYAALKYIPQNLLIVLISISINVHFNCIAYVSMISIL